MHSASEIADLFDARKTRRKKELEDWVMDNPQWWAVGLATVGATSMDFLGGFVDVLRLGEGAAEGGAAGYGMDALRLISILGPLGRLGGTAARFLAPLAASGRLRFAVGIKGVSGPCTFQAVSNAMAISGAKRIFLTVAEMANAKGVKFASLVLKDGKYQLAAFIDNLVPYLRTMGARIKEVRGLTNIDEVVSLAQRERAPVIFAIRTEVRQANGTIRKILHSVVAMRTRGGIVQFADYYGKFYGSLEALVSRWGVPTEAIVLYQKSMSAVVLDGATLTGEYAQKLAGGAILVLEGLEAIETSENGVEFAVPLEPVAASASDTPKEVMKGSFDAYKARQAGKPVIRLPDIYITAGQGVAPRPDYLTGVQFRLNALGFGAGPVDGIMGPKTRNATEAFQRAYPKLRIDGVPGPRTQARLVEVCGY